MQKAHIDLETRSTINLPDVGLNKYARHPDTDVWCMAWAIDDMEPELWLPGMKFPEQLRDHILDGNRVYAHNAPFELGIWHHILMTRYKFPKLDYRNTYCTMAMSYAMGLPGALEDASMACGLPINKDKIGRTIMLKYAKPWRDKWMDSCPSFTVAGQKWTGTEGLLRLYEYCRQDVRVERGLEKKLLELTPAEREVWEMDYEINTRGMHVDMDSVNAAVAVADEIKAAYNDEMAELTGGLATTVDSLSGIKEWLAGRGVVTDSLAKDAVVTLMEGELPDDVRRALTIRQEAGKSSLAKLGRIQDSVDDTGHVYNILQYHGAATGRWAGRMIQPHNFPRDVPKQHEVEHILELIREGKWQLVDLLYGPPVNMLSKCIRGFFIAQEGYTNVAGDFSSVEGRGTAWCSGEDWKIKAFEAADAGEGPGIYELAYSNMFNVPVESVGNPSFERQVGKVSELAFGYGGGVGAFHSMARNYGVNVSDEDADEFKKKWRKAHPNVVKMWSALESAAIAAVAYPGDTFDAGPSYAAIRFKKVGSFLCCQLPSGRVLFYPSPKLMPGNFGKEQLTYMKVPSQDAKGKGKVVFDKCNTNNWARITTWGGTLLENVVQAICRDLLVYVMLELRKAGALIWLHVHDEIVIKVAEEKALKASGAMQDIMRNAPDWAAGFPMTADCHVMKRYGK